MMAIHSTYVTCKNSKTGQFLIQYVLTVVILFALVFCWEFLLEGSMPANDKESAEEHWEYVVTVVVFGMLALMIPTVLSIKEWSQRQKAQKEVEMIRDDLKLAVDQTLDITDYKILNGNFASMIENPQLVKCWEIRQCGQKKCPCFGKEPMRCWQTSETPCDNGKVSGFFPKKYDSCYQCEVFKNATSTYNLSIRENLNNMMHVMELQKKELSKALDEIKTLRGIIPICSYCRKIRNDQGLGLLWKPILQNIPMFNLVMVPVQPALKRR